MSNRKAYLLRAWTDLALGIFVVSIAISTFVSCISLNGYSLLSVGMLSLFVLVSVPMFAFSWLGFRLASQLETKENQSVRVHDWRNGTQGR